MRAPSAAAVAAVLLLLAACGAVVEARALSSTPNRRGDFDYFFLVRQWPATFCNDHSCTHRPPKKYAFTVHGLWPQRRDGTWPEYCDPSSHLHMQDLYDLLGQLEAVWPSWSSADETFWDHEWNRHGTCAAAVLGSQRAFFRSVLALHSRLNIQSALADAGIRPSNSARYPVQDIKDAIEAAYGVMPHVTCDGEGALAEVWMCVNKKLKPIDCVDDPRPHASATTTSSSSSSSSSAAAAAVTPAALPLTAGSSSAPPNYNCNMVRIPKLRRRQWGSDAAAAAAGGHDDGDEEDGAEADADAAEAAAEAVAERADAAADAAADAIEAAFEQQAEAAEALVHNVVAQAQAAHSTATAFVGQLAGSLQAVASSISQDAQAAAAAAVAAVKARHSAASISDAAAPQEQQQEQHATIVQVAVLAVGGDDSAAAAAGATEEDAGAAAVFDGASSDTALLAAAAPHSTSTHRMPLLAGGVIALVAAAAAAAALVVVRLHQQHQQHQPWGKAYLPVDLDEELEQLEDADDSEAAVVLTGQKQQLMVKAVVY